MSCAICETRKEKRFCPAVHGKICPQCCGTEREVSLDCPSSCVYLRQAREHERPRSAEEMDAAALFPHVEVPRPLIYQREPLVAGLTYAIIKSARADRSLNDRDAIGAVTALVRKYETLVGSGLHLQEQTASLPQQAIAAEMQKMLDEYRQMEAQHAGYSSLRDSEVLAVLVFIVRMAHGRTSGRPKSRAFLDFLAARFPEKEPAGAGSSLIIP